MKGGQLYWKGEPVFVSETFQGQSLGLRASHDRYYEVLYGPLVIGWFDTFRCVLHRKQPKPLRETL